MAPRSIGLDDRLYEYLLSISLRESPHHARLREETAAMPMSIMQIAPEQGQFLSLLVELIGAQRTLEVGTFTGYSTMSVALALPAHGQVIACDISEEYTSVARRYWAEAGIAHKIDLRLGPALETLDELIAGGAGGTFDFAFIDADKVNYLNYYERALELLRPGGLIAIDNVLWSGAVADSSVQTEDTDAIRAHNRALHQDHRVSLSLVPIGDGLTLTRKR